MKRRLEKKKLKAKYPGFDGWKPRRLGYMERLHKCPICDKARRAGYFKTCANCAWVPEFKFSLTGLLSDAKRLLESRGAKLRWNFYNEMLLKLRVSVALACDVEDVAKANRDGELEVKLKDRVFSSTATLHLRELWQAHDTKQAVLAQLLGLFQAVQEKATELVDDNMKAYAIGETLFPRKGNWRK